ncbi:MAG: GrpB family protein [bacterium]
MLIGLKRGLLQLVPYSAEWDLFFDREKQKIMKNIGRYVLTVEHIGSTSIKNMYAKPIIDIAIGLQEFDIGFKCLEPLKTMGYLFLGEYGIKKRHFFRTDSDIVKCHIHMYDISNQEYQNHILFRDYLREHEKEAKEYAELKKNLLLVCGNDREKYTKAKAEFIDDILKKAKESN